MRSPENRLCGFLGGGMEEASGSGRAIRTRAPAGRPLFGVAGGGAAGEAPIFRIEAAAHQPPLGGRIYFLESRDAGEASSVASAAALVTSSAKPGREGGEVAAGGDDPPFLIRVPLGAQGFGAVLIGEGDVQGRLGGGDPRRADWIGRTGSSRHWRWSRTRCDHWAGRANRRSACPRR